MCKREVLRTKNQNVGKDLWPHFPIILQPEEFIYILNDMGEGVQHSPFQLTIEVQYVCIDRAM